jgi:hypothetical protein
VNNPNNCNANRSNEQKEVVFGQAIRPLMCGELQRALIRKHSSSLQSWRPLATAWRITSTARPRSRSASRRRESAPKFCFEKDSRHGSMGGESNASARKIP